MGTYRREGPKGTMKHAMETIGFRAVALTLALTLTGVPAVFGHACTMTDDAKAGSGSCTTCAFCAKPNQHGSDQECCCSPSEAGWRGVGVDRCSCGQNPSDLPPALPADPSQNRINPLRSLVQIAAILTVSSGDFGFGDMSDVGICPSEPSATHLLCCVWRC